MSKEMDDLIEQLIALESATTNLSNIKGILDHTTADFKKSIDACTTEIKEKTKTINNTCKNWSELSSKINSIPGDMKTLEDIVQKLLEGMTLKYNETNNKIQEFIGKIDMFQGSVDEAIKKCEDMDKRIKKIEKNKK